jgi:hypothetical protein
VVAVVALTASGASSAPVTHRGAHVTGIRGDLEAVTVVPHSGDIFAIDSLGSVGNNKYTIVRRHHGHWSTVKVPKLGGRYGHLDSLTSASPTSVFLGGAVEVGHGDIQEHPTIWRFNGHSFAKMKLPSTTEGATAVGSMSASSPKNVWAGGGMWNSPADTEVTAHWDGHKWTFVPFPPGSCYSNFQVVSTSSPTNAWGYELDESCGAGDALLHWDGKSWTAASVDLTGVNIFSIATSGPKLAYAVGYAGTATEILKWNGKTWSKAKLASGTKKDQLYKVAIHGKSAWAIGNNAHGHTVILHTGGGKWTSQSPGHGPIFLNAIVATSAKHALAVGTLHSKTFVDYFNGHKWVAQAS